MRRVSFTSFLLTGALSIFNFMFLISTFITSTWKAFFFLTLWTYWANSLYLTVTFICDINLYINKSENLERLNGFFRNYFSIISFTYSYGVSTVFWLLAILGSDFMKISSVPLKIFFQTYLHGIITLILLVDLWLHDHKTFFWNWKEISIVTSIICIYLMWATFSKYVVGFSPYPFMEKAAPYQLITPGLLSILIFINSYQIHLFLLKKKNKGIKMEENQIIVQNSLG